MAEVVLDNPMRVLNDLHDLQDRLPRAIIHPVEKLVQPTGKTVPGKVNGGQDPLLLLKLVINLYGQAEGLEAAAGIAGMVVRQPIHPGSNVLRRATRGVDDTGDTQHGPDAGTGVVIHENSDPKQKAPTASTAQLAVK